MRFCYDALGGRDVRTRDLEALRAAGGQIFDFFPSRMPLINLRVNNRTHRKLVVVDGRIGYIGGFNVGDEYLGVNPKFGYWRDTHLRVQGSAVNSIQRRLLTDWNAAAPPEHRVSWHDRYFPAPTESPGGVALQIASSGPDSSWERIKFGYVKMINSARRSVWIQTPYFMPDAAVLDALKIAARSGLDVRMMIPDKPDHLLVYPATLSYADELAQCGAKIYIYRNGFVHAKTVLVDHEMGSVGTANMDIRSFRLNFEVNAFFYDAELGEELRDIYLADVAKSTIFDRATAFGRRRPGRSGRASRGWSRRCSEHRRCRRCVHRQRPRPEAAMPINSESWVRARPRADVMVSDLDRSKEFYASSSVGSTTTVPPSSGTTRPPDRRQRGRRDGPDQVRTRRRRPGPPIWRPTRSIPLTRSPGPAAR